MNLKDAENHTDEHYWRGTRILRRLRYILWVLPLGLFVFMASFSIAQHFIFSGRLGRVPEFVLQVALIVIPISVAAMFWASRVEKEVKGLLVEERQEKERYKALCIVDGLTELYNYRYFRDMLVREVAMCRRYSYPLALLMVDVDDFKVFNDIRGHLAGDNVLRCLATSMRQNSRSVDVVARYGGEEFAIIMPHINKHSAAHAAERLRQAIEKIDWRGMGFDFELPVTISAGIADFPSDASTDEELISKADQALYEAKGSKNCVRVYGESLGRRSS